MWIAIKSLTSTATEGVGICFDAGNAAYNDIDTLIIGANDSSLPNDVRMKLGMLKLVDDDQFIENIGCRVNSYTFVVTLEQGETK